MVIKLRSKNYITSLCNCCIIAQKLLMLKQGIKTVSFKFVQTCSLSRSVQNLYNLVPVGFSLLWQCQKVKGPWRWAWTFTPSFKTSVDARFEVLVSNVDYLEIWYHNFIQKNYGRKRRLPCTQVSFSGL